jgi:exportin-1
MITKNFEDYPEHRLKFFSLLRAIATHCFPALICLSSQVFVSCLSFFHESMACQFFLVYEILTASACQHLQFCSLSYIFGYLCQQLKLVMDSIMWAFRHTERNIAETGLNLLLEMLKKFQVWFFCVNSLFLTLEFFLHILVVYRFSFI